MNWTVQYLHIHPNAFRFSVQCDKSSPRFAVFGVNACVQQQICGSERGAPAPVVAVAVAVLVIVLAVTLPLDLLAPLPILAP